MHALQGCQGAAREPHGVVIRRQAEIVAQHLGEECELGVRVAGAAALDGDQTLFRLKESLVQ